MQAASIDSPEKQRLTIEKFLQANVRGSGASPMDHDALAKTKKGMKGGSGKDKGHKSKKFDGNWYCCGSCGHVMEGCRKKAAGKPRVTQTPRGSDPKPKGKGKRGKGTKGASSLDEWPDGQDDQPSIEKPIPSLMSADTNVTTDETGEPGKGSRSRRSVSGRPGRMDALAPILLTLRWVRESI